MQASRGFMLVFFFYTMLLDFKDLTLTFAGAAHPPLLQLNHGTNQYIQWPSSSTFLGIMVPMPVSFESERIKINRDKGLCFILMD